MIRDDAIPFSGIYDLKTTFRNQSLLRLKRTFLNRELPDVAFALGLHLEPHMKSEHSRLTYLLEQVEALKNIKVRTCNCVTPPTGMRWQRFDDSILADPVRVFIDHSIPFGFEMTIAQVVNQSSNIAFRFSAVITNSYRDADVVFKYGHIDGPSNTLGTTTYWTTSQGTIYEEGGPVIVMLDERDLPPDIDTGILHTVVRHEFEHVKGHDHTPESLFNHNDPNILDAFYNGIFTGWGFWDRFVNQRAYGGVIEGDAFGQLS